MLRPEDRQLARSLGARARAFRQRISATQEEVAEMVGLSPQVYARLERGGVLPSLPTLMRLCQSLSAKPDDLLVAARSPDRRPIRSGKSPELVRLVRLLSSAEPRTIRALLQFARDLSSKTIRRKA